MGPVPRARLLLVLIWVVIATRSRRTIVEEFPDAGGQRHGRAVPGAVAQQALRVRGDRAVLQRRRAGCTWTYLIQYVQQALNGSCSWAATYLQVSLIVFLISRFFMTWVIGRSARRRSSRSWRCWRSLLCVFAMLSPNLAGVTAVVGVSFCLSLMFPTIYGVALQGLGPATKFGAAGLVMAIVGGAIMPLIQGKLARRDERGDLVRRSGRLLRRRRPLRPATTCRARPACTSAARRTRSPGARHDAPRGRGRRAEPGPAGLGACGSPKPTSTAKETKQLEVMSWWTSGSEAAAAERPAYRVPAGQSRGRAVNAAVVGGAGSPGGRDAGQTAAADNPPDVWQTFTGKSVQGYAERGTIATSHRC